MRVCSAVDCPNLIPKPGRCPTHARDHEQARGTRTQRGYGSTHVRLRHEWEPRVAAATVNCARCGQLIQPGQPWDLGHDDHDRSVYQGPEHQHCNRATANRKP